MVLRRAWRDGRRCGPGRKVCQRIWNSAKTRLRFSRQPPARSSIRSNRSVRVTGRRVRTTASFSRRNRPVRITENAMPKIPTRSVSLSKTTPHPLDEYIFSTLLKRTKHKKSSPMLQSYRNHYVNHSALAPAYNERCIDTCVAEAAANRSDYFNPPNGSKFSFSPYLTSILPAALEPAPELPPRPYPRHQAKKMVPIRPPPRTKTRTAVTLRAAPKSSQSRLQSHLRDDTRTRRAKKAGPPSTPSSSGVSSGEEGTSHNTTRDASSYMDPQDAAQIWQMVVQPPPVGTLQGLARSSPGPHRPPANTADEVDSEMSSVSWHWCAQPNHNTLGINKNATAICEDERPPLPPKKGKSNEDIITRRLAGAH